MFFSDVGGSVCTDRISNCPLDRVLTYKNLIYLLNLQVYIEEKVDFSNFNLSYQGISSLNFGLCT